MRTVAFKTVGCRLNQAETVEFEASFRAAGYRVVPFHTRCDAAIVHGCAVTTAAERDSLRWTRTVRQRSPGALIVVAGCAAEQARRQPRGSNGVVDLWVGQSGKTDLATIVTRALATRASTGPSPPPQAVPPDRLVDPAVAGWSGGRRTRALVKIQDGCPFRCAYCIVPLLRPRPFSRPVAGIRETVGRLAAAGCREIVLTGANLGSYADGPDRLPDVLHALLKIENGPRIRLGSIEPATVETQVIDIMAGSDRLCRTLHLPLQSGDDGVLRRMGRRHTVAAYRDIIAYARQSLPIFGLGTDLIVGFPGETERAFEQTVELVTELPFTNLHVFPFSPRPGTAAAEMADSVPATVKRDRVRRLNRLGAEKQARFAASLTGRPVTVLVERVRKGVGIGWTGEYLPARITLPDLMANQLVTAPISGHDGGTVLIGQMPFH